MRFVLTESSSISCDHPPTGGGPLVTTAAAVGPLKVAGATVLCGSLAPTTIDPGCSIQPSQSTAPCIATTSQSGGTSAVLKVAGQAVLLETAGGETAGKPSPGNTWSVKDANQTILKAE
jgi:hypothetical protein